jgi:hypothetical protein
MQTFRDPPNPPEGVKKSIFMEGEGRYWPASAPQAPPGGVKGHNKNEISFPGRAGVPVLTGWPGSLIKF